MRLLWLFAMILPIFTYAESNEEEALFLRRISEFWEEGEYTIAKAQMEEFVARYPQSDFTDALHAALGDLSLREKNYSNALECYSKIESPEFSRQVFLNKMECLYEMQWYPTLADECESFLETETNPQVTYLLAIALYQQCLNASKDSETALKLAIRAKPHFEALSEELSNEAAESFAHLCSILKDYPKASELYLDLAENDPSSKEEMLFQAALVQSEYDKEAAIGTFDQIVSLGQKRAKEAAYNKMALAFEIGRYEELEVYRENLSNQIPEEKSGMAHLFLGRSLMALKKYPEAIDELKIYLQEPASSETFRRGALSLVDASYQNNDLNSLDFAIEKLEKSDPELPKAYFYRAQILKANNKITEAKKAIGELIDQFPQFPEKAEALLELAYLEYSDKNWDGCYRLAKTFLDAFPDHQNAPYAWSYFIGASAKKTAEHLQEKTTLVSDLKTYLSQKLPDSSSWQQLLAATQYELGNYEEAFREISEESSPNALLLKALCYRDQFGDLERFCHLAEEALQNGAELAPLNQIHAALFNAYLQLGDEFKAEEHLYLAFEYNGQINPENLLWLGERYYKRLLEGDFSLAKKTATLLEKIENRDEPLLCKLAKVYSILGLFDQQIALLENLSSNEAKLLLGESYAKKGNSERALELFDAIVAKSPTMRNESIASAALQSARIKINSKNPDLIKIAETLKNLVIQKTLLNEPLHLEAALDYIDLQAKFDPEKKRMLLSKMKFDFERTDDLLSKDYHAGRLQHPDKDKIYQSYMKFIDAEILKAEALSQPFHKEELQVKAKELLLQIEETAVLKDRIKVLLDDEK